MSLQKQFIPTCSNEKIHLEVNTMYLDISANNRPCLIEQSFKESKHLDKAKLEGSKGRFAMLLLSRQEAGGLQICL